MGEKNFRQPTPLVGKVGENTRNIGVSQTTIVPACRGDGTHDGGHFAAVMLCLMKGEDVCGSITIWR